MSRDSTCWPDLMWPRHKNFTTDVKLINEKVRQVWLRCSLSFSSYPRQTTGGPKWPPPPPGRRLTAQSRLKWRHKIRPIAKIFVGLFRFFLHETTPNWCPERYVKFRADRVNDEEVISQKPRRGIGSDSPPPSPSRWRGNRDFRSVRPNWTIKRVSHGLITILHIETYCDLTLTFTFSKYATYTPNIL